MITATAILTGLFFGGISYIIYGFWQEQRFIKTQIKALWEVQKQKQEIKQKQKEAEIEFYKRWKQLGK